MSDHVSKIIQAVIAIALVIIAVKLPWPEASAQQKRAPAPPQMGSIDRPSFVVVRAIDNLAAEYLARCIALKTQDAKATCLQ
jgi:hypothetical protein